MGQGRELVEQYFKAVNAADLEAMRALLTPDAEFAAPGPVAGGPDMVVAWMGPFLGAFPRTRSRWSRRRASCRPRASRSTSRR